MRNLNTLFLNDIYNSFYKNTPSILEDIEISPQINSELRSYNINLGAKDALEPSNNLHFNDKEEFLQVLPGFLNPGDCILVKGSRGMEMDKVVSQILKL